MRWTKSWRANLLVAVVSTLVSLIAAEFVLRLFVPYVRGSHQHPSRILRDDFLTDGRIGRHDDLLGWTLKPNVTIIQRGWEFKIPITTNSRGQRDDEVSYERTPGRRRILLLGDSFMMGDGVERQYLFADLLEHTLKNTEVVNLGVSGYGTDQELLDYLGEGKKYKPDVVLLALTIDNDFDNNIRSKPYGLFKPYFVAADDKIVLRGTPVPPSPIENRANLPDSLTRSPFALHDFLDARSALYAAVFDQLARVPALRRRWETSDLLYARKEIFYSSQVGILSTKLSPQQADAWDITLRLLQTWQAETRRSGSRPVLFLVPSHLQVYPNVWKQVMKRYDLTAGDWDPDYPNRRLNEFCQSIRLDVIDPLPDFRAAAAAGRHLYYMRNPHWNREGHLLAAKVVARELPPIGLP
jgi:hypothetical protein